ncbi:hypothetical protein HPB50_011660 [Hyalomma asiaticum]|uniref:Uncharacterized protein n=1 Tax=Hyalomma asiaticum TaxID=266040 RepID=A0ACB7SPW4_HYAAI|nr:hypothetical protein HPB50_011660 [Hyalomma asiaticum]
MMCLFEKLFSTIKASDVLLLLMAFGLVVGSYMIIRGGPMGRSPLLCTVGVSDLHHVSMVPEDGLCVYLIFTHYYHSSGDTFVDDHANKTRAFLQHAARSSGTTFGLSVTYRNVAAANRDVAGRHGQRKLRLYWSEKRIYHYGVLDAEYYGFPGNRTRQLQLTFDLLKAFRKIQKSIEQHSSSGSGKHRGFVILGVTPWVRGGDDVFKELSEHMRSFSVDGLVLRTHLFENDITSNFGTCQLTPPTSYEKPQSDYLLGMADMLRLYKKHRQPSWRHNVMVSFTMALRWYKASTSLDMGAPCDETEGVAVRVIDATHACEVLPDYFANTMTDNHSQSMTAHGVDGTIAMYDDAHTIIHKMCALSLDFPDVKTGAALFDIDFQDWKGSCTRESQAALKGSRRLRDIRIHYRKAVSSSQLSGPTCSDFSTETR